MNREEAIEIIGQIMYDCEFPSGSNEALGMAIESLIKLNEIESLYEQQEFGKGITREERDREVQKILEES